MDLLLLKYFELTCFTSKTLVLLTDRLVIKNSMSPRTREQFAEIRSQSEQKIIDAALELFASNGYKATSISQIASAAGVSKGLMYNYFDSKKALLRKIISNAINDGKALFDNAINDYDNPEEELEHLVLDTLNYIKENVDLMRLLTMLSFQKDVLESIIDLVEDSNKFSIESCVSIFTKLGAKNPMQSALLLGATMDGILLHFLHMKDEYPFDQMSQLVVQTFLDKNSIHRTNTSHEKS